MASAKSGRAKKPARSRKSSAQRKNSGAKDALALLRADHKHVSALFDAYEGARSAKRKQELSKEICSELKVHTTIEEEIFYPALRRVKGAKKQLDDMLDEANVEHAGAKHLIGEIERSSPGDDYYDARIKVLSEYIRHHVKEEQDEIFPKAKKSKINLQALGEQLAQRKMELKTLMLGLIPR
jgi:hemerythrin superfamily protein